MKDADGRWQDRFLSMARRPRQALPTTEGLVDDPGRRARAGGRIVGIDLKARIATTAIAFRGYDVSNLGRSMELLEHPVFGPVVSQVLGTASGVCSEALGIRVDLARSIRAQGPTSLATFPQDVAMIVAMEVAQVRLLEQFFEVPIHEARLSFGYSIGELAALVLGGVYAMEDLLSVPLGLASDCAELAADSAMGILFTRGPSLPTEDVQRLCRSISGEGRGLIGPSAFLSPNTVLVLGQGDTLDRLGLAMKRDLPEGTMLRRNPNQWPPLHTPLVWQRNIPNRAAMALHRIPGGERGPIPRVLSGVTGSASYDASNSREILARWTDHPQRLWDMIDQTLASGVEVIVHAGPQPNLIPATFARLSNNVSKQLGDGYLGMLGRGVVSRINRHAWLGHLLPSRAALLRAPFLVHVSLEDWLLDQPIP